MNTERVAANALPGIAYLGIGIFPHRVAGDKNFLLDLRAFLHRYGIRTHAVSIADEAIAGCPTDESLTVLRRPLHRDGQRFACRDVNGRVIGYYHKHGAIRELLELALTLVNSAPQLRQLLRREKVGIVHWLDLSLALPIVRLACGRNVRLVCSVPRCTQQGSRGDLLRATAVKSADAIITATEAARSLLVGAGCNPQRVFVAAWGSSGVPAYDDDPGRKPARDGHVHLLWTGPIQQIGEADLYATKALAGRVARVRTDIDFTFCVKPEVFRREYLALQGPQVRITAGGAGFLSSLPKYDALLSPILRADSTLAPPLTWIEALSAGVPVLTTQARGIEELLTQGQSTLILDDYHSLEAWLRTEAHLKERLQAMRDTARQEFERRYHIDAAGHRFLDIYRRFL